LRSLGSDSSVCVKNKNNKFVLDPSYQFITENHICINAVDSKGASSNVDDFAVVLECIPEDYKYSILFEHFSRSPTPYQLTGNFQTLPLPQNSIELELTVS